MPSDAKVPSQRDPIIVGRSKDGEIFSRQRSSAGAFRVMDAGSFSKASRRASKVLSGSDIPDKKQDRWRRK